MTAKQRDDYSGIVRRKSSKGKTIDSIEAMNKKDLEDALKALKESVPVHSMCS